MRLRYKPIFALFWASIFCIDKIFASGSFLLPIINSTKKEALEFLNKIDQTKASPLWPNVKPTLFYDNLKLNLNDPTSFYPGRSTNFCSYGALSFLVMEKDPLGYIKFMNDLYTGGEAIFNGNHFTPSKAVMQAAGTLQFKGVLDIRHAEQMWFLVLSDKFKGYLNFFNKKYDTGDENTFWAATNLAKFNRMVRKMCGVSVKAVGSDLIRPSLHDPFNYVQKRIDSSIISLYINNRIIHKRNHDKIKFSVPTHFIIVRQVRRENNMITLRYWDYGGETEREMTASVFKKIIFGIITIDK
ncbi:MAG TPA: hypothetical protein VJ765_11375 [Chitinophagaceae bacterium]|nr:hypothetical protein [Chitinophagaceae bacterium]